MSDDPFLAAAIAEARAGLAAYLADPDQHVEQSDRSIHPCYLSNRLLPAPSRS